MHLPGAIRICASLDRLQPIWPDRSLTSGIGMSPGRNQSPGIILVASIYSSTFLAQMPSVSPSRFAICILKRLSVPNILSDSAMPILCLMVRSSMPSRRQLGGAWRCRSWCLGSPIMWSWTGSHEAILRNAYRQACVYFATATCSTRKPAPLMESG